MVVGKRVDRFGYGYNISLGLRGSAVTPELQRVHKVRAGPMRDNSRGSPRTHKDSHETLTLLSVLCLHGWTSRKKRKKIYKKVVYVIYDRATSLEQLDVDDVKVCLVREKKER